MLSKIPGHIAEIGVADGRNAIYFAKLIKLHGDESVRQYLGFDSFDGFLPRDLEKNPHLSKDEWKENPKEAVLRRAEINDVEELSYSQATKHPTDYRPWGHFDSLIIGDRCQVKKIVVNPGGKFSLQKHHHRAEHWIVVRGTAKVQVGDKTMILSENQSTYIPLGVDHRLSNTGKVPLTLIEIQTGSYLGEDDIVRLKDIYERL